MKVKLYQQKERSELSPFNAIVTVSDIGYGVSDTVVHSVNCFNRKGTGTNRHEVKARKRKVCTESMKRVEKNGRKTHTIT